MPSTTNSFWPVLLSSTWKSVHGVESSTEVF